MALVDRMLEPKMVLNQKSGRVLGIKVKWREMQFTTIINVYAPNDAKSKSKPSTDLLELDIEGEWCIVGDFNMNLDVIELVHQRFLQAPKEVIGPDSHLNGPLKTFGK